MLIATVYLGVILVHEMQYGMASVFAGLIVASFVTVDACVFEFWDCSDARES